MHEWNNFPYYRPRTRRTRRPVEWPWHWPSVINVIWAVLYHCHRMIDALSPHCILNTCTAIKNSFILRWDYVTSLYMHPWPAWYIANFVCTVVNDNFVNSKSVLTIFDSTCCHKIYSVCTTLFMWNGSLYWYVGVLGECSGLFTAVRCASSGKD